MNTGSHTQHESVSSPGCHSSSSSSTNQLNRLNTSKQSGHRHHLVRHPATRKTFEKRGSSECRTESGTFLNGALHVLSCRSSLELPEACSSFGFLAQGDAVSFGSALHDRFLSGTTLAGSADEHSLFSRCASSSAFGGSVDPFISVSCGS